MRNLILSCAFIVIFVTYAQAGNIDSAYTKVEVENCLVVMQDSESGSVAWMCEGYRGMELYVAEGDLRFFVSAGPGAAQRTAASQTLGPFKPHSHHPGMAARAWFWRKLAAVRHDPQIFYGC